MGGVVGILLAAGSARRFGGDKLREQWRGRPLLAHALAALCGAGTLAETLLVIAPGRALGGQPERCRVVENPAHAEGMGSSLRAGVAAASADAEAYVIALADMPAVQAATVDALVAHWRRAGGIVVPTHAGRRGHPVVFGGTWRAELLRCAGDEGARALLAAHAADVHELAVDDPGVGFDIDTPAELQRVRP